MYTTDTRQTLSQNDFFATFQGKYFIFVKLQGSHSESNKSYKIIDRNFHNTQM